MLPIHYCSVSTQIGNYNYQSCAIKCPNSHASQCRLPSPDQTRYVLPKYTSQQQVCGKIYYQTSPTLGYTHSCDVQHTWLQHLVTDVE